MKNLMSQIVFQNQTVYRDPYPHPHPLKTRPTTSQGIRMGGSSSFRFGTPMIQRIEGLKGCSACGH